jgi:lysyl-tRNA synthetase class II
MSKNKLVIDLRRITLTDKQRKSLHTAIHTAVTKEMKKISVSESKKTKAAPGSKKSTLEIAEVKTTTATLTITFNNVNPGLSELNAILNDEQKTIDQSGDITFNNIQSGDIIEINGESLGTTTVTIDVSADPVQMNFSPGHFNENFFIN